MLRYGTQNETEMNIMLRLAELLEQTNTTHAELAKHLGLNRTTVSHYAAGRNEPDIATLIRIADFFHVSVDYLVGRDMEPESPYTGEQIVVDPEKPVKLRVNNRTIEIILAEEKE